MSEVEPNAVYTVGHSTRTLPDFLALLRAARVACLVDVRRLPGSRAMPQFDSAALHRALHAQGVAYVWAKALGGRRGRSHDGKDLDNAWWQHPAFRNYADYAQGPAFARALARLESRARKARCAIMCAEAVWWRCHRRIIADHLMVHGFAVFHIMGPGHCVPATLSAGARLERGVLKYPSSMLSATEVKS